MTYYINPIWFYLIDVCGSLKVVLGILSGCLIVVFLIGFLIITGIVADYEFDLNEECEKERNKISKKLRLFLIFGIISLCLFCVTPTKEGVTKMMIASVVTYENVESVKGDAKEIIDYITERAIEIKDNKTEE